MHSLQEDVRAALELECGKPIGEADVTELYQAVSKAVMMEIRSKWREPRKGKRACLFSGEFLTGRLIYANLLSLGLLGQLAALFHENNIHVSRFEEIEDAALGDGGQGRLAACLLDSAATQNLAVDGYGLRYRYGLFRQRFSGGFQCEEADDWQRFGDPWSVRREEARVRVDYKDQSVYAVPYDMPVIGYGGRRMNTLRLWQAEPVHAFDYRQFYTQRYEAAVRERDEAEQITSVLYPSDDSDRGKRLRLKQQYFFTSASLQNLLLCFKREHGDDFSRFPDAYAIQLNGEFPVVAVPELIRLLVTQEGLTFGRALKIARQTFAYTNHTMLAGALEKWDARLFRSVIPEVWRFVSLIHKSLQRELTAAGMTGEAQKPYLIVEEGTLHMARLAVFATHATNGVSRLHTEALRATTLRAWDLLYPGRLNSITNGVTQRRWLALANQELAGFITDKIGNAWLTSPHRLKELERFAEDPAALEQFAQIKRMKKQQASDYVFQHEGERLHPDFIFDIQGKRIHSAQRQLLNVLSILDIYYGLREGRIEAFYPTVFLFGGKAAPKDAYAKGIIKLIHEIAALVNRDPCVESRMKVAFVSNYDVSYAEKLIPAGDISEQIATAGAEASGTGNMKFMLNGAVTLGARGGANVEIVQQAGLENNYLFGAHAEELRKIGERYDPQKPYEETPRIHAVVDTLAGGKLDDGGTGIFRAIHAALLTGNDSQRADPDFVLFDLIPYCDARLRANADYASRPAFTRKCLMNTANAGRFSSDRTVLEYAKQTWDMV